MGDRETGLRAFTVYYAASGKGYGSAFVAVGALLGIKPVGSDAEHIVALDTDAVEDSTNDRAGLDGLV